MVCGPLGWQRAAGPATAPTAEPQGASSLLIAAQLVLLVLLFKPFCHFFMLLLSMICTSAICYLLSAIKIKIKITKKNPRDVHHTLAKNVMALQPPCIKKFHIPPPVVGCRKSGLVSIGPSHSPTHNGPRIPTGPNTSGCFFFFLWRLALSKKTLQWRAGRLPAAPVGGGREA